jgi:hypothetical protein
MEISPTLIVAIIGISVTVLGLLAAVHARFVRLEAKSGAYDQDISELYKHAEDRSIHHPQAELDRRFNVLEGGMEKIEKGIEKLVQRFDNFLSK